MFTYLCNLAAEIMPDARRSQIGPDMVEFRRLSDNQFVFLGLSFGYEKKPMVVASVLEDTAARLGVTCESTSMLVKGQAVPVTVRRTQYANGPVKIMITHYAGERASGDFLRYLVGAM